MKIQKQFFSLEEDNDDLTIGLVRLAKDIPDYELFFTVNRINHFCFSRIEDLVIDGEYFTYKFAQFQAYHHEVKTCFRFIRNISYEGIRKKESFELFSGEESVKFLLHNHIDVDYIATSSDVIADFSLILLPDLLVFQIQEFPLSSDDELYQIIQYYE
ncbi:IPExxxVDY family protein [Chryseobacterium sp.]|uniref:IPExxxVDY family protein n=1 Tax=Chryseobacterium sp. TaxID=1871047 RepID=UPI0011CADEB4|nr:IPExxxVDY family protein [Chryseobacterium sp.]TXF77288.1 IPExxxVDY family protein [Chryseobacterium sp.]